MNASWNITQLNIERKKDLLMCQDESERAMCDALSKKGILSVAMSKPKLTPGEISVLLSLFDPAILKHNGIEV